MPHYASLEAAITHSTHTVSSDACHCYTSASETSWLLQKCLSLTCHCCFADWLIYVTSSAVFGGGLAVHILWASEDQSSHNTQLKTQPCSNWAGFSARCCKFWCPRKKTCLFSFLIKCKVGRASLWMLGSIWGRGKRRVCVRFLLVHGYLFQPLCSWD